MTFFLGNWITFLKELLKCPRCLLWAAADFPSYSFFKTAPLGLAGQKYCFQPQVAASASTVF